MTSGDLGGYSVAQLALELVNQMRGNPVGGRLSYVISDGRIASIRTRWAWVPYGRSCPHRRHVHFSIKATHRDVVRPWSLGPP